MFASNGITPDGENILGRYNVEVARWAIDKKDWVPTMPPLYASLTATKLILQTQTRKKRTPAQIPIKSIKQVVSASDNYKRRVVILHLKNDYIISLYTPRQHVGKDFLAHLRLVVMPSPVVFQPKPESINLERIIHFVQKL